MSEDPPIAGRDFMSQREEIDRAVAAAGLLVHDLRAEFGFDPFTVVIGDDDHISRTLTDLGFREPLWAEGHGFVVLGPDFAISIPHPAMATGSGWEGYVLYMAEYTFQAAVAESPDPRIGGLSFPTCPRHPTESMEASLVDGIACWTCRGGPPVVRIGSLGEAAETA